MISAFGLGVRYREGLSLFHVNSGWSWGGYGYKFQEDSGDHFRSFSAYCFYEPITFREDGGWLLRLELGLEQADPDVRGPLVHGTARSYESQAPTEFPTSLDHDAPEWLLVLGLAIEIY